MKLVNKGIKVAVAAATSAALIFGVAACGSSEANGGSKGGDDKHIVKVAGGSEVITRVFNPFLPESAYAVAGARTWFYEPLVQVNVVKVGEDHPWLAESWEWTNENKTITFKLREGVKWTDGEAFDAEDVVFTYEMLKEYPALNTTGVKFVDVKATDSHTVVMNFEHSYEPYFFQLASLPIVPQHLWGEVEDPTLFADENPIGTGAFTLGRFSGQSYTVDKNPNYWQEGKPVVDGVQFIAYKDNQAQINALLAGNVDWAGTFLANAEETFLEADENNRVWAPNVGMDGLIPNLEKWPLSELSVRQAVSYAIDRVQVGNSRNSDPATSVIGLPMPAFENLVAPEYKGVNYEHDVEKAKATLEADGFTMGADGFYEKDGKRLEFKITVPSAYTEIIASSQVMVDNLKVAGIDASIDGVSANDINNITSTGDFQATSGYPIAAPPNAFLYYDYIMGPDYYVPTGEANPTWQNIERFKDPEAKKLFDAYRVANSDEERSAALNGIQRAWVENLPMITAFYWGYYGDWSEANFTGFPDEENPYFQPNPNPVTAINLVPATK